MDKSIRGIIIYIIYMLIGLSLLCLGTLEKLDSFWSGMGSAILVVGVVRIIQIMRYKTSDTYRENIDIAASDERIRFITAKSKSIAFYISVIAEAVSVIVLYIIDMQELSQIMGIIVCVQLLLYYVTYLILRTRY